MNLSLLYPGHANDLHIKTACDPPRTFRHPSICPGIDHQVSGRNQLTPRTISTPSHELTTDLSLSLRIRLRLTSPINYTLWPVLQNVSCDIGDFPHTPASRLFLSGRGSLHAATHDNQLVSGTFNFLFRDAFQYSLTLLFHYRF